MKPSVEQISSLLSQRQNVRQEEGYWQDFLKEFHHNQRIEANAESSTEAFFGKIRSWFSEVSPSKWAYGAGLAYATATVAFIFIPRGGEIQPLPTAPVNHQVVPAPSLEQLNELDFDPSTEGHAGEQVF